VATFLSVVPHHEKEKVTSSEEIVGMELLKEVVDESHPIKNINRMNIKEKSKPFFMKVTLIS